MKKTLLLLLISTFAFASCGNKKDEKTITIACNLPLTGPIGYIGNEVKCGLDMAANDMGNIKLDYQDNVSSNKNAVSILNKQILNNPDYYMSASTNQTMAIKDILFNKNIPHFLWSFTPLQLDSNDRLYRALINLGNECEYIYDFINKQNPKKLAFIYVNTVGTKEQCEDIIAPTLKQRFPEMNIMIDSYEISETSFKNNILKIKDFAPDVIIIDGYKDHMLTIAKELSYYKLNNIPTYYSYDMLDASAELESSLIEGTYVCAPAFYVEDLRNDMYKKWEADFYNIYNRKPKYMAAYAYDLVNALQLAHQKVDNNISFDEAFKSLEFEGITGKVNFDENGELKYIMKLCTYKNGQLIPVE